MYVNIDKDTLQKKVKSHKVILSHICARASSDSIQLAMSFASSAQGPASLPSSYAFLSHFSGRLQPHDCVEEEGIYDAGRSPARPQFPAMGSYPRRSRSLGPTEATPLLTRQEPPVPSAEEQLDNEPMFSMVKKEMVILTNYSLPVFVLVRQAAYFVAILKRHYTLDLNYSSTVSLQSPSSPLATCQLLH